MQYMFKFSDLFNGDISAWDTSKVTIMYGMFYMVRGPTLCPELRRWMDM